MIRCKPLSIEISDFIRSLYKTKDPISLHVPSLGIGELKNVNSCINEGYVSSVGKFVNQFETAFTDQICGVGKSVAVVNGTSALHLALLGSGISKGDFVITQPLTFVATCNAISYIGADIIFCDVSDVSLGLCPIAVRKFLEENAIVENSNCIHKETGRKISGILPMHTFGHPVDLDAFIMLCHEWNITLIEDCAESLGSFYKGFHTGTFGNASAFSFNGNKIITTGGGGMCYSNDHEISDHLKHLSTTAKISHDYEFHHDAIGYNYRMPNINAALGLAQLERFSQILSSKRSLANAYKEFFKETSFEFFEEPTYAKSNYWLNCIFTENVKQRDELIKSLMENLIYCRPAWELMSNLKMFKDCIRGPLPVSTFCQDRIICLPSSPTSN